MVQTLTQAVVNSATATGKMYYITDSKLAGFALRVSKQGYRAYVLRSRIKNASKDYTIGTPDDMTPVQARENAMKLKLKLSQLVEKKDEVEGLALATAMSLYLVDKCDKDYNVRWSLKQDGVKRKDIPDHIVNIEHCFDRVIKFFGPEKLLRDITKKEIYGYHVNVGYTANVSGNRHLSYLSSFFKYWIEKDEIEVNPCLGVKKYKENPNKEGVPAHLFHTFIEILKNEEDKMSANAVIFSCLTGLRTNNVLKMKWVDNGTDNFVNFNEAQVVIRKHKTQSKTKKPYKVPVLDMAIEHLQTIERQKGNVYVFSSREGSHVNRKRYTKAFSSALAKLELDEDYKKLITPYCTRHTFTNYLVDKGMPFEDIAHLLTHTTTRMLKERYGDLDTGYKKILKSRLEGVFGIDE